MFDRNIDSIPIPRRSERERILLFILLAVDSERLLAPWWVDDLARGLVAGGSAAGDGRLGWVGFGVGRGVVDLSLNDQPQYPADKVKDPSLPRRDQQQRLRWPAWTAFQRKRTLHCQLLGFF